MLSSAAGLLVPMLVGVILALFLNVPTNSIERGLNRFFDNKKKKPSEKAIHSLSFFTAFLLIVLVIAFVVTLVIPEILSSVNELFSLLDTRIPQWVEYLNAQNIDANWLEELLLKPHISVQGFRRSRTPRSPSESPRYFAARMDESIIVGYYTLKKCRSLSVTLKIQR